MTIEHDEYGRVDGVKWRPISQEWFKAGASYRLEVGWREVAQAKDVTDKTTITKEHGYSCLKFNDNQEPVNLPETFEWRKVQAVVLDKEAKFDLLDVLPKQIARVLMAYESPENLLTIKAVLEQWSKQYETTCLKIWESER